MSGVKSDTCGRPRAPRRWRVWLSAGLTATSLLLPPMAASPVVPWLHAQEIGAPENEGDATDLDEPLADVVVEGNTTIATEEISKKIKTRPGRAATKQMVKADVKALYDTRWFFSVETRYRRSEKGLVLVFKLRERPILQKVEFKGNKKIKEKNLIGLTGLTKGSAYDVSVNREAARRLESHYREKGYIHAKVELEKGDSKLDREVVFKITEGPKVKVRSISFEGNQFAGDDMLRLKCKSSSQKLWLIGGQFDPANIAEDIDGVKHYYQGLGFFDVQITPEQKESEDRSKIDLVYKVEEGLRYKIRNVIFAGNRVIKENDLKAEARLHPEQYFNERALSHDINKVNEQYGKLGRLFTKVDAVPRFLEEPGTVDIVFNIEEDVPRRIGVINVHIGGDNPHTRESVVLNRLLIHPGDLADPTMIKKSQARLRGEIFKGSSPGDPEGPQIAISKNDPEKIVQASRTVYRGQGQADPNNPLYGGSSEFEQALQDPTVDLDVNVQETQTGRLMFGAGFNTDVGVVGSFVLEEKNFDIGRFPSSFRQLWDGTALRGAGQQFRLEAVPGSQISRYAISFRDPYLFDQDVSLGVSAFYYNRFFNDWAEDRLGGRVSLGKQFTNTISASMALRLEDVDLYNPTVPSPQILTDALGHSTLSTFRVGMAHDTRDTAFLPGKGHYAEIAYEQAFGEFSYPRAEFNGQQYFTVHERPDGSGRHIITLAGNVNYTGDDTPIYERYFAGGFQSFRGFAFRGVSPVDTNVRIGGQFLATGSLEYMVPVTVDDNIQIVTFTDFGTVENNTSFTNFRLAVGAGLRVTVPALGPVPIALDWSVPILREDFDQNRLFSFYVGAIR